MDLLGLAVTIAVSAAALADKKKKAFNTLEPFRNLE